MSPRLLHVHRKGAPGTRGEHGGQIFRALEPDGKRGGEVSGPVTVRGGRPPDPGRLKREF